MSADWQLPVSVGVNVQVQFYPADNPPAVHLLRDIDCPILLHIGLGDPLAVQFLESDGDPAEYRRAQEITALLLYKILRAWCAGDFRVCL